MSLKHFSIMFAQQRQHAFIFVHVFMKLLLLAAYIICPVVCCCCLDCLKTFFLRTTFQKKKRLLHWFDSILKIWHVYNSSLLMDKFLEDDEKKKSDHCLSRHIILNIHMTVEKRSYLKGTINIGHCRGHECIILIFCFKWFYDKHRDNCQKIFILDKK